ncbi:MAG: SlyX family protein [Pseudomonadales bacterium]|nr:SlyX family protein [Pseudomonadales bacterium]
MNDKTSKNEHNSTGTNLETRLVALEERVAFQEDYIDALNQTVSIQDTEIKKLWSANRILKQQLDRLQQDDGSSDNAPPPHY